MQVHSSESETAFILLCGVAFGNESEQLFLLMDETMQNLNFVLQLSPRFPRQLLIFKGNRIDLEVQESWQKETPQWQLHGKHFKVDCIG